MLLHMGSKMQLLILNDMQWLWSYSRDEQGTIEKFNMLVPCSRAE